MNRAYSLLTIKAVDEEQRIIEGIATTPETDRAGDIVDPMGAEFTLPIPLCWQHESGDSAIGEVFEFTPTKAGIKFKARVALDSVPGLLKDRLDYAWRSMKLKLVRGVSIGFQPIGDPEPIPGTWGLLFRRWLCLELSPVTIPANASATIQNVKSFSAKPPSALGPVKLITPKSPGEPPVISKQIETLEATKTAKLSRQNEIQKAATDAGITKDAAQREEFDALTGELDAIEIELKDLKVLDQRNAAAAKPAVGTGIEKAAASRETSPHIVQLVEKLDPGIEFARFVMCLAAADGNPSQALNLAKTFYPQQVRGINVLKAATERGMKMGRFTEAMVTKADVAAATTTDATWASPLVSYNTFTGDFVEFLRPRTLIGQFGANGVPALRSIPFNVAIKGQTVGGTGYWVGEGKPKPVTKFGYNSTNHGFTKVAAIAVLTEETIRFSDPSAERLVRDSLADVLIERADLTFIDPSLAAVSGVSPASITNGVTAIVSSGDTADAVRTDIAALWAAAMAAKMPLTSAVYITTPSIAMALGLLMNPLGQKEFPDMTMTGGRLLGVPVIVSEHVPTGLFILAFASEIYLSDDGTATIDASRDASLQMMDNPTNDSVTPTATSLVSMFQTDSVALRAHRLINWSKRRSTAVALLNSVDWGTAGS